MSVLLITKKILFYSSLEAWGLWIRFSNVSSLWNLSHNVQEQLVWDFEECFNSNSLFCLVPTIDPQNILLIWNKTGYWCFIVGFVFLCWTGSLGLKIGACGQKVVVASLNLETMKKRVGILEEEVWNLRLLQAVFHRVSNGMEWRG